MSGFLYGLAGFIAGFGVVRLLYLILEAVIGPDALGSVVYIFIAAAVIGFIGLLKALNE